MFDGVYLIQARFSKLVFVDKKKGEMVKRMSILFLISLLFSCCALSHLEIMTFSKIYFRQTTKSTRS